MASSKESESPNGFQPFFCHTPGGSQRALQPVRYKRCPKQMKRPFGSNSKSPCLPVFNLRSVFRFRRAVWSLSGVSLGFANPGTRCLHLVAVETDLPHRLAPPMRFASAAPFKWLAAGR